MVEEMTSADEFCDAYLSTVIEYIRRIQKEERDNLDVAARLMAKQISEDRLVHVFGPGGHSNLATQEVFFRAGGLMHMNAILDEGTLLSNGALRSMAIERTPDYGRIVIDNQNLEEGDLLIFPAYLPHSVEENKSDEDRPAYLCQYSSEPIIPPLGSNKKFRAELLQ